MLDFDGTLIIAIISFVIFVFLMNAVLYRPVIKILEERQAFLKDNEQVSQSADKEAEEISEKKQNELADARALASKNVSSSLDELKKEQKTVTEEYTKEQREKAENEKNNIIKQADSAKKELDTGIENISDLISQKILGGGNV